MNIEHSPWCSVVLSSVDPTCDCGAQEHLDKELELQRLRRVEQQYTELKTAAWDVEKAFLHNQGSMDRAIDVLSDLLQEEK